MLGEPELSPSPPAGTEVVPSPVTTSTGLLAPSVELSEVLCGTVGSPGSEFCALLAVLPGGSVWSSSVVSGAGAKVVGSPPPPSPPACVLGEDVSAEALDVLPALVSPGVDVVG